MTETIDADINNMISSMTNAGLGLIRTWHVALLSGNHIQGTGCLEEENINTGRTHQCCLGVLCRVAVDFGISIHINVRRPGVSVEFGADSNTGVLPDEVTQVLFGKSGEDIVEGYHDPYLIIDDEGTVATASDMNDTHHYDFVQIAAAIKRTWPEAFTE